MRAEHDRLSNIHIWRVKKWWQAIHRIILSQQYEMFAIRLHHKICPQVTTWYGVSVCVYFVEKVYNLKKTYTCKGASVYNFAQTIYCYLN